MSGGVTVNSVTFTDSTHVTLNLNTAAASNGPKSVTITNPDGQIATGSALFNAAPLPPLDLSVSFTVDAKGRQMVGKLKIKVSSNEAITGEIGGKAVVKKRAGAAAAAKKKTKKKIKPKSFSVAAGATKTVRVKFKRHRKSVRKPRNLLRRKAFRKKSRAKVKVSVTDTAGNSAKDKVKMKLKR